jgi:hypothetical protein
MERLSKDGHGTPLSPCKAGATSHRVIMMMVMMVMMVMMMVVDILGYGYIHGACFFQVLYTILALAKLFCPR